MFEQAFPISIISRQPHSALGLDVDILHHKIWSQAAQMLTFAHARGEVWTWRPYVAKSVSSGFLVCRLKLETYLQRTPPVDGPDNQRWFL